MGRGRWQIFVYSGGSSGEEAAHASGGLGLDMSISTSQKEENCIMLPNAGTLQVQEGGEVAAVDFLRRQGGRLRRTH